MKCLVTGAAGFIGSHLCEGLLNHGHTVQGVDCFVPYYDRGIKESNLAVARQNSSFQFHELDLREQEIASALDGVEVIFHLAAMPGLVKSWSDFHGYMTCNVQATQRLLEAIVAVDPPLRRLIYISTSSVYGKHSCGDEAMPTRPVSPYGITKLAGEQLCNAYSDIHDLPLVTLRYFSVYGPRQRPDMGYYKFIQAALEGRPVTVYGDGHQARGNTYVTDCVSATTAAAEAPVREVYNIGGEESASVWDILRRLEAISGRKIEVRQEPSRPGDQRYTFADTSRLKRQLGWKPRTTLEEGLKAQWEWQKSVTARASGNG